eukprot:gnl/MRDRNA2_/MRDRNA2_117783_c0_seq1.p1 gnl/MRDRNA2_/MRDRNA2_117783_c0~~gnl/MRDRNA2_/MRDRNA2_117783_c0_seq1.p1  ORF type:complete len:276 (+),score=74.50 gnl/MRDRNA2_/MRDRNA2_117783_c0_seq1:92-919(+)
MLALVLILGLVPSYALTSKGKVSATGHGSLSVETSHAPSSFSWNSAVVATGRAPKGEAEKIYQHAVEELKKLGYPEMRIQMFTRDQPAATKSSSSLAQTGSKWSLDGEATEEQGTPIDIVIDMPVQAVPTQEYVIVSDKGPDGTPLSAEQKEKMEAELARTSPNAKRISGEEADKMMKEMMGPLSGALGNLFGGESPFGALGGPNFEKAFDMGGASHGGVTKTTTVCENGKCTRTEEYTDPNWKSAGAAQPVEAEPDVMENPAEEIELQEQVQEE